MDNISLDDLGITQEMIYARIFPIRFAPRNGQEIIGFDSMGHHHFVWGDERGFFAADDGEVVADLEWWSPLPTVPRQK